MTTLQARLVREGVTMTNAFIDTPICCPARTSALSGRYAHNLGDQGLGWCGDFVEAHQDATWIRRLQSAGYVTGYFGKLHNDYGALLANITRPPAGLSRSMLLCNDNVYYKYVFADQG